VFDGVAGVAFGQFSDMPEADEGNPPLAEVLLSAVAPSRVPAVAGLPFGHASENWTLPLGVRARLDADAGTLALLESAVV
ncbi:MAG TPA: hypothetical protein VJ957_08675, partial [Longimicrobiales bacterium]|nr:hypothetical protein [Longimicrobiales bacterium]